MATIGHLAVGLVAARLHHGREPRVPGFAPLAILYCGLALLPDADVLGFGWGIPYSHAFGHRGAAHSTVLALGLGLLAAFWFARSERPIWPVLLMATTLASHGLLDALTDGGKGIALLWPLSEERFFAPWTPIPVAPIGLRFVSLVGLKIALAEAGLFFPLLTWALWPQRMGRKTPLRH